jgi:predicted transcriptional regulator
MSQPPRKKGASFGTFLDTVRQQGRYTAQNVPPETIPEVPQRLLHFLKEHGPVPLSSLMKESGIGFAEFGKTLDELRAARLIDLRSSKGGEEEAELTKTGEMFIGQTP